MAQKLAYLKELASQTAGPYVHIGLSPGAAGFDIYKNELGHDICGPNAKGERVRIEGQVIDGMGSPIKDVLLEVWQANAEGHYAAPAAGDRVEKGFRGWGRVITDFETGEWSFETVKPGKVAWRDGRLQAPHISFWLVARGINIGLQTRLYFGDEEDANAKDPVLNQIEWDKRRATLIAAKQKGDSIPTYRFEIQLQGEHETVFFDF